MPLFSAAFYGCPPGCGNVPGLIFANTKICEDRCDTGEDMIASNTNIPYFFTVHNKKEVTK